MTWACTDTSSADTGSSQTISAGSSARARDHDALALAAGELVRIALGGVGPQADAGQQLGHAFADGGAAMAEIAQRFADDVAHAHARVHRRERILEDELHAPAHGAQRVAVHRGQVLAFEQDAALGRIGQPDQALAGGGLAAAGFADQAQGLAARHRQRDAVDRAQHASAVDRVVFLQAADLQHGRGGNRSVHVSVPDATSHVRCLNRCDFAGPRGAGFAGPRRRPLRGSAQRFGVGFP